MSVCDSPSVYHGEVLAQCMHNLLTFFENPKCQRLSRRSACPMHAEFINVLVNPRWRPAAILDFQKFCICDENYSISVMARYADKFQPQSSIHAEVINILVIPRWRPAAILDFRNIAFLMKLYNFCHVKVYAVQISAKKAQSTRKLLTFW